MSKKAAGILICGLLVLNMFIYKKEAPYAKPENVVAYLYTYTCRDCGYTKAEGDYSFSVEHGIEYCPECQAYNTFDTLEESSFFN